jgi:hypothetical protein
MKIIDDYNEVLEKMMHRRPFSLFISKSKKKPVEEVNIPKQMPYFFFDGWEKDWYCFSEVNSNLLVGIDENNVALVRRCLKQNNIGVNQRYVVPAAETLNMEIPHMQNFLNRAAFCGSVEVFAFLLESGANPRSKSQNGTSVLADIASYQHLSYPKKVEMGKLLIDAGLKKHEISRDCGKQIAFYNELYGYHLAKNSKKICQKQLKIAACPSVRTRE